MNWPAKPRFSLPVLKSCLSKVLITHRTHKTVHTLPANGSKTGVRSRRICSAMNHCITNGHPCWHAVAHQSPCTLSHQHHEVPCIFKLLILCYECSRQLSLQQLQHAF